VHGVEDGVVVSVEDKKYLYHLRPSLKRGGVWAPNSPSLGSKIPKTPNSQPASFVVRR